MHNASGVEFEEVQALHRESKGALSFPLRSEWSIDKCTSPGLSICQILLTFWGSVQFSLGLLSSVQSHSLLFWVLEAYICLLLEGSPFWELQTFVIDVHFFGVHVP